MFDIKQQKVFFFLIKDQLTAFKVTKAFNEYIVGNSYMKMLEWNLERRPSLNKNRTRRKTLYRLIFQVFSSNIFPLASFYLHKKTLPGPELEVSDHCKNEVLSFHVTDRKFSVKCLGWVVRKPVNVNPGLNVN